MRIIRVTPEDLVNTRFSYSPLLELVMSYRVLTRQEHHGLYRRWVEDASQSVFDMEFPYLDALTSGESYIPDFLTPTPLTLVDDIEDELRLLLHTPTEWIQKSVQRLIDADGDSEIRSLFLVYPHELLIRLVEELRVLWVHTLEGHWSHMKSVLDGDILYRAKTLALQGANKLISELYPGMYIENSQIVYNSGRKSWCQSFEHELSGDGLQLVPAIFSPCCMWQLAPEWRPMICYTPRGTGLWWRKPDTTAIHSLELTIGEARAHILQSLEIPASTGEVAHALRVTSGAVSQHLSLLNKAGLVENRRSGKRVYYSLTERGEELLKLFS